MFDDSLFRNLFGIYSMLGNYEQRVMKNTKTDKYVIDTVLVTDRSWSYETAVMHKYFNDNQWIIVDCADSKEEAEQIHEKWEKIMKEDNLIVLHDIYELTDYYKNVNVVFIRGE